MSATTFPASSLGKTRNILGAAINEKKKIEPNQKIMERLYADLINICIFKVLSNLYRSVVYF